MATITLRKPTPRRPSPIEMTARLGSARPMLDALMARNEPRWMWPSHTPSGIEITIATPIAAPDSTRCSPILSANRLRLSKMKPMASMKVSIGLRAPQPRPGSQRSLQQHEQRVGHQRQHHRERARGHELRLEPVLDGVEDRLAEAAHADERGHRSQADRGHGRDPDPGHDRRQRQRQLYAHEDLARREPHGL